MPPRVKARASRQMIDRFPVNTIMAVALLISILSMVAVLLAP